MNTDSLGTILPLVLSLSVLSPRALAQSSTEQDDFSQRLEQLATRMDAERIEKHIPGMALAVVRGDELVFASGFGIAELGTDKEVTPQTIFPIGSTTKSFTATLIGILADEGRLEWDDPVTQYLPWFELEIDRGQKTGEEVQVTLRDLLCHRTGFVRMNGLLMNNEISAEEILRAATGAEPWAPFRSAFHYSNVMFMAAGVSAGVAAESDWESAIRTRLIEPLGMTSTYVGPGEARKDPRLAEGYMWEPESESFQHRQFPNTTRIAPAGAIHSNAIDMARWLRFQLAGGVIDGERLIDSDRLAETWRTQTPIAGGASYGLGWMLRDLGGRRVVEHGGNVQGFSAEVCMFPDADLGFVLLINAAATPLQKESMMIVADLLLEEPEGPGLSLVDAEDYLGEYVANYLTHDNEVYEVLLVDGKLTLNVPTQRPYALDPPQGDGPWHFALTDTVAVTFERDAEERVVGLAIHQSGFHFEVPRKGFEPVGEISLEELQPYLGRYQLDGKDSEIELTVREERLAVSIPGVPDLLLNPPDEEGIWKSRTFDAVEARFELDVEGEVVKLSLVSPWFEGTATPVAGVVESTLPTLEEVLELRGNTERGKRLSELGGLRWGGEVAMPQSGVTATFSAWADGLARYRQEMDFGRFGYMNFAVDGDHGWVDSQAGGLEEISGARLAQVGTSSLALPVGDWFEYYESARVLGTAELDGRAVVRVRLTPATGPAAVVFVDLETGDTLEEQGAIPLPGGMGAVPIHTRYGDWREVDGLRMPFRITTEQEEHGRVITVIEEITTGLSFEEDHFQHDR